MFKFFLKLTALTFKRKLFEVFLKFEYLVFEVVVFMLHFVRFGHYSMDLPGFRTDQSKLFLPIKYNILRFLKNVLKMN